MNTDNELQLTINDADVKNVKLTISGRLDIHTTAEIWQQCLDLQAKLQPQNLTIVAENIHYCDGAGIALLQTLYQKQTNTKKQCVITGLQPNLKQLLDKVTATTITTTPHPQPQLGFTIKIGHIASDLLNNLKENITFMGALLYLLLVTCAHPNTIRWRDLYCAFEDSGPNAIPIIILIGFVMGLITAFQSALPLETFGAQIYIANLVGISLVRELGPLMTSVLVIGRTSSSFAAEIGTMKINQEIDALITMGLNPIRFLAITRVIATTLMTPLLNMFMILFGLIGCGIVMLTLGYNLSIYLHQLNSAIFMRDFIGGLVKTFAFGFMAGSVGCLYGLKTKYSPSAVGEATTKAVVNGIILLIIMDGIFACIYYALGV